MANGVNLSEAAYAVDQEGAQYLYASVGAISLYAFREERAIPLRPPDEYEYGIALEEQRARSSEVLLTRSGATGVAGSAWAAAVGDSSRVIIPSGFVIRISCNEELLDPRYLASILNHPLWRAWSNSLSAGKEQRNLSQEHLRDLRIPALAMDVQKEIAGDYAETLVEIKSIVDERTSMIDICDRVIRDTCGLAYPDFAVEPYSVTEVSLARIADGPTLRIDPRHHQQAVRRIVETLHEAPTRPLAALLAQPAFKGRQPDTDVTEDESDGARVIATVSVQEGQIVNELTKPARSDAIEALGPAALRRNDVVVTMDGEGSIGRAAMFDSDQPAATDSHLAVLRLANPEIAPAICCYLNSGLAQAQIELAISGSTGQTQLSKPDLEGVVIPAQLIERADDVSAKFREALRTYEALGDRVRRIYCDHAARTSEAVIDAGAFGELADTEATRLTDPTVLLGFLTRVRETSL
jgi:hypothetical protein